MIIGCTVWNCTTEGKLLDIIARNIAGIFVALDIVYVVVSPCKSLLWLTASIAPSWCRLLLLRWSRARSSRCRKCTSVSLHMRTMIRLTVLQDTHIYMTGVAMQQTFTLGFLAYAIAFHRSLGRDASLDAARQRKVLRLLYVLYLCLLFISVSNASPGRYQNPC